MELEFATLAKFAEANSSGHIDIINGGFNSLTAASFPTSGQPFYLVLKVAAEPHELDKEHRLRLDVSRPNGERVTILENFPVPFAPNPVFADDKSWAEFVLDVHMPYPTPGKYGIHIIGDGRELSMLRLYLTQQSDAEPIIEAVPVNTDTVSVLQTELEDDWSSGEVPGFSLDEFKKIAEYLRSSGQASM